MVGSRLSVTGKPDIAIAFWPARFSCHWPPANQIPQEVWPPDSTVPFGSSPLALSEHGHAPAVGVNAVDVGLVRAEHPVDVNEALVAALRRDLLGGRLAAVDEALRIALPQRDVAGGVLVEQRVEEQQPAFRNRGGMRHQRYFAEPARALVGIEHLVQHFFAARGFRLDDAP